MAEKYGVYIVVFECILGTGQRGAARAVMAVNDADANRAKLQNFALSEAMMQLRGIVVAGNGFERRNFLEERNCHCVNHVAAVHDDVDTGKPVAQRRGQQARVARHVRVGNDAERYGMRAQ